MRVPLWAGVAWAIFFSALAADPTVVTPQAVPDVLVNPGKGWVLYGMRPTFPPEILALSSTAYSRFEWAWLNPAEDVYDWSALDQAIAAWKAQGKKFAFGVMCLSSSNREVYATPKWVFDAGAKGKIEHLGELKDHVLGTPGEKMVPDFADPIFQNKLRKFINALAARYDGSPDIAYIDVRSYGNWGEGHLFPFARFDPQLPAVTPGELKSLLQMALDAFHHTRLVVPWGEKQYNDVYDWAIGQGMGIRRDGICGNSDGSETARALGKTPAVFEFYDDYPGLKKRGWWQGTLSADDARRRYGFPLAGCVEKGQPTWIGMGWGQDAVQLWRENRPLVEKLANRMGYHFVLTRAEFPQTLTAGTPAAIDLRWLNDGVAPIYIPAAVALALLDDRGQPVEVVRPAGTSPASWMPGAPLEEKAQALFSHAPPGTYRLAAGLVQGRSTQPTIRLGIAGRIEGNWYPLGPVTLSAGK